MSIEKEREKEKENNFVETSNFEWSTTYMQITLIYLPHWYLAFLSESSDINIYFPISLRSVHKNMVPKEKDIRKVIL